MDHVPSSGRLRSPALRHAGAGSADIVSAETRSRMMAAVAQKDTRAELQVREILHTSGIRYRIRNGDLPGSPDIANRSSRWAVFVNGCFWHGHKNCRKTKSTTASRIPKTRAEFWSNKLVANRVRDAKRCRELRRMGYRVLIIWECDLFDLEKVADRLRRCCAERGACEAERL
ncbi:MAG: DNA mismatch endonuclease Vsr [Acidobacteria bacterium]|nr:DNA mismatch endonuclease Vsr [Acidobacteriota bacterium]